MITGYKKKKLGHPSEKLSGDVPRASWRAVIFSEVLFPIFMAVLFIIAYMFVKSFPDADGKTSPSPLVRIAIISIGPIVWNAAVLLVLFLVSLLLGPMLDPMFPKFGSVIAFIAHILGVVGMLGFFEFLVCPRLPSCYVLSFLFILILLFLVVLGVLGRIACCSWSYLRDCHPTRHSQDFDLGVPFSRIQT